MPDGFPVERTRDVREPEDRLQFRGKEQLAVVLGVVERLDPEAVAREQKLTAAYVPDGEAEHAAKPLDAARAEVFVEMDDGFGVAVRAEDVTVALEVAAQFAVVVDLAVEDDPDGAILVRDGLVAAIQVDDAEAPHADGDAVPDVHALIVGTAMHHCAAHVANLVLEHGAAIPSNDSGYAAHGTVSLSLPNPAPIDSS